MDKNGALRRVLIITYYWPPSGGAGVQRWLKFSKYLRSFGLEPVIYTPENPEAPSNDESLLNDVPEGLEVIKRTIAEPYSYYKKMVGMKPGEKVNAGFLSEKEKPGLAENISVWIRGNFFIPDARCFWIRPSVRFLLKYLSKNPVDAIVSTGPPHSMHMIAMKIHLKMGIPWLADFRDPWTGIDFYQELKLTKPADRLHHRWEKMVLSHADAVTVVSRQMIREFGQVVNRNYELISNGFDDQDMNPVTDSETDTRFSITHVGSLAPSRNPEILWKVLSELIDADSEFAKALTIKLVGKVDIGVLKSIEKYNLGASLLKIDYLPHDEVVKEICRSQLLLLLINNVPNAGGIVTGKLFEYLASGRPVLNIGPVDGDAADIINRSEAGVTVGFNDENGLKEAISRYYLLYRQGRLTGNRSVNQAFSRKNLTGQMADVLKSIMR